MQTRQKSRKSPISTSRIHGIVRGSLDRIAQRRYTRDLFDDIVNCPTNISVELSVTDEEKLLTLLRCFNNFFNKKFDAERMMRAINFSLIKENSMIICSWMYQKKADNIYVIGRFILHITSYLEAKRDLLEPEIRKADNFFSLIFSDSSQILDENLILIFSFLARKGYFRSLIGFILSNYDLKQNNPVNIISPTNNGITAVKDSLGIWIFYLKYPLSFAVKWRTKVEEWIKAEAERVELYGSNNSIDEDYSNTSIMNLSIMSVSSEFSNEDSNSRQTRLFLKGVLSSWCNSVYFNDTFYQYFVSATSITMANSILITTVPIYLIILALVQPIRQKRKFSLTSLSGGNKTLLIQYKLNANPSLGLLSFLTSDVCQNQMQHGWPNVGQEEAYGIIVCLHLCIFGVVENPITKFSEKRRSSILNIDLCEKKAISDNLKPVMQSCVNCISRSACSLIRIALSGPLDPDVVLPLACLYRNLKRDLKVTEKCVLECSIVLCKHVAFIRYLWSLCLQSTVSHESNSLSSYNQRRTSDCGDKSMIIKTLSDGKLIAIEDMYTFLSVLSTVLECVTFHLNTLYLGETHRKSASSSSGSILTAVCSNFLLWPELWNMATDLSALSVGLIKIAVSLRSQCDSSTESYLSSYRAVILDGINEVLSLIRVFYTQMEKLNLDKKVLPEIHLDSKLEKLHSSLSIDDMKSIFYQRNLPFEFKEISFFNESNYQGLIQLCILRQLPQYYKWEMKKMFIQKIIASCLYSDETPSNFEKPGQSVVIESQTKSIFQDSFKAITKREEIVIKNLKQITFNNVTLNNKDFFNQIFNDGMDPEQHLFSCDANQLLYPNPYVSNFHSDYKSYYEFLGTIFAMNIVLENRLKIQFAPFFLDKVLNISNNVFNINDLKTIDMEVAKNLLLLSKTDEELESFNFRFVITQNTFGKLHTHEVVPDGADIPVTKENKNEYIHRVVEFILDKQIIHQCESFKNGINAVFPAEIFNILSSKELNTFFREI